ncbi:DUF6630 family protein [Alteromonas sp. PRIM-21]|uniref:DUF6630 family protein n=1 Tax=Alteromonas sp. PRIM-21 TaxID=1454978 RepID=UPI0022B97BEF|nr:hypothetical protein [Alteromonas sp. PRIM-21]MCZ8530762.1 hypothetical protein [Alteromonas sp. PRIM-21]
MREFLKKLLRGPKSDQQPLVALSKLVSRNNPEVMRKVRLFESSPNKYFEALDEDLKDDCFIESPTDISTTFVLVRALYESNLLAVANGREEPLSVLDKLNLRSEGLLEKSTHYEDLKNFYAQTKFGFGSLVGGAGSVEHSPDIFTCARAANLAILAIDDSSDLLVLFVCPLEQRSNISLLAKQADVRLFFENM